MEWTTLALILFGAMLLLLFLGINIPFALGIMGLIGIFALWNRPTAGLAILANEAYGRSTNFLLLAIPMFVLLAEVIISAGISEDAYEAIARFLCRVPGALGVTTVALSTAFAALTGSSLANAAIIGRVSIPQMLRHKYDKSLAGGVVAAGGTLGILIPPSIPMIFYALFSDASVGRLFMAGVVPGLIAAFVMAAYVIIRSKLDPKLAPPPPTVSFSEAVTKSYKMIPMVVLIGGMLIAFYIGLATPTEIGALAAFCAFVIAIIYRRLTWEKLKDVWANSTRATVMLMWILITALSFGIVLGYGHIPQNITKWVVSLPLSPLMILIAINVFLLILGCILETGAIMMIVWPLLIGIAQGLGFDLIWFAILLVIQMELGQITPPVAIILFTMQAIAPEISMRELYKGVMPFVVILVGLIALIIAFPQIALWLPNQMIK